MEVPAGNQELGAVPPALTIGITVPRRAAGHRRHSRRDRGGCVAEAHLDPIGLREQHPFENEPVAFTPGIHHAGLFEHLQLVARLPHGPRLPPLWHAGAWWRHRGTLPPPARLRGRPPARP